MDHIVIVMAPNAPTNTCGYSSRRDKPGLCTCLCELPSCTHSRSVKPKAKATGRDEIAAVLRAGPCM